MLLVVVLWLAIGCLYSFVCVFRGLLFAVRYSLSVVCCCLVFIVSSMMLLMVYVVCCLLLLVI